MRITTLFLLFFISCSVSANTIYKCKQGNSYLFSQTPCDENNATISVDDPQSFSSQNQKSYAVRQNKNNHTKQFLLNQKKKRIEAKIAQLSKKKNKEIAHYETKALEAGRNRAGMLLERSVYNEMQAALNTYEKQIDKQKYQLALVEKQINSMK